jgi:hypothetical protein
MPRGAFRSSGGGLPGRVSMVSGGIETDRRPAGSSNDGAVGERGQGRIFPSVRWRRPGRRIDCPVWCRQPTLEFAEIVRKRHRRLAVVRARGMVRVRASSSE